MKVLGVDPGTAATGYGLVEVAGPGVYRLVECGVIRPERGATLPRRLHQIHEQLDPVISYNVLIHTNPPIESKALQFNDLSAREINIPASQGFLKVELSSSTIHNNLNSKIKCIVRKSGSTETVQVQNMNTSFKYLSGSYDLEILTLPRIQLKNIAITQKSTTSVKIDVPGVVTISKTFPGFGAIFINDNGRLVKIYSLNENLSTELVGLQPGEYTAIFRPKSSKRTTESITKTFQIKSGQSFQLKL